MLQETNKVFAKLLILGILMGLACIACQASQEAAQLTSNRLDDNRQGTLMSPTDKRMDVQVLESILDTVDYAIQKRREQRERERKMRENVVAQALEDMAPVGSFKIVRLDPEPLEIVRAVPTAPVEVKRETARWNQLRGMWGRK